MKTYVLTISQHFPQTHSKKGLRTEFINSLAKGWKKHTIRGNFELWEKRFKEIESGNACLSVRYWSGKPYRSPQKELIRLTNKDGIGIDKIQFHVDLEHCLIKDEVYCVSDDDICYHDGLTYKDFKEWFKGYDLSKPMALIYFSSFRYKYEQGNKF